MQKKYPFFFSLCFIFLFNSCKTSSTVTSEEKKKTEEVTIAETKEIIIPEVDTLPKKKAPLPEPVVQEKEPDPNIPHAMREFRAAWVATVANINWPSKPGLSSKEQQKEAIALLDFLKKHNFNAVILQVRPQADALYESELEPWSYFLTGEQGKAPEPFYDPLHFWIEAAHDRGLELHAWLNPYRAHHTSGGEISEESIIKTHPELVVKLKNGMYWMDPSKEGTQKRSTAVVMDIVKRYDIDGIHFDDYFYPYDSYNGGEDFPDDESWKAYRESGGKLSRADWRRESVNTFIRNLYKRIKAEKPHVKFGISPFGIWRPGYPKSIRGYDQYNELYADARLWLRKGWVDYFTPQLYWTINQIPQSFPVLLG
ncbi:MAG TPA: family 10 glycosylhydrolase, partial [Salinimicrobium sp.]|nr:family 10 glycosylhydrolase [Salinimicrobium sp.]